MKKLLFMLCAVALFNCSSDDDNNTQNPPEDLTRYNPDLTIVENLDNGVAVLDITAQVGIDALHGIEYGGGYIFHVNETNGTLMVATDYSSIGQTSWGDHFDLTNGAEIGAGYTNTQQIVEGNLADNSNVANGLEFGSNDYAFKIVWDLEYAGYNDWFVPSKGDMEAIFDNVHMQGMGNFDETLFYWTSTKDGYQPYVMTFNPNTFSGDCFLGTCFASNAVIIVRSF
jgi:hypothetical protein